MRQWRLLVAAAAVLVGASVTGAPAAPTAAPTFTLVASPTCKDGRTLLGRGCVDRKEIQDWVIGDGNVRWDAPGRWLTTYQWTIPQTVPAAGARVHLALTALQRSTIPNNRICPAIGVATGFTVKEPPPTLGVCAEAVVKPSASDEKDLTVVPSSAAAPGSTVSLTVGVQDGPSFVYTYKAASASPGCTRAFSTGTSAAAKTKKVTFTLNHSGVPPRGESPTLEASSTGGQGSFVICADTVGSKWVAATQAKGTVLHIDRHELAGRSVSDRLALKVVGARLRTVPGEERQRDDEAELFVKVVSSNDGQCKVGKLGSIRIRESTSDFGEDELHIRLCGRAHDHDFDQRFVPVKIRIYFQK